MTATEQHEPCAVWQVNKKGELTRAANPFGDDFSAAMNRIGYRPNTFGEKEVVLYERASVKDSRYPWPFVVEVIAIKNHHFLILVDDLPSLLAVIPKIIPLLVLINTKLLVDVIREKFGELDDQP